MRLTRLLRQVAPVESFAEHAFDNSLTADIQRFSLTVQFLEHRAGEVYVDSLDSRSYNRELIRKVR